MNGKESLLAIIAALQVFQAEAIKNNTALDVVNAVEGSLQKLIEVAGSPVTLGQLESFRIEKLW